MDECLNWFCTFNIKTILFNVKLCQSFNNLPNISISLNIKPVVINWYRKYQLTFTCEFLLCIQTKTENELTEHFKIILVRTSVICTRLYLLK